MLKRLALKYWPLALLLVLIVAVLCMSDYAERRKAENQEYAQASSPESTVSPSDTDKGTKKTNKPKYPPSWIDTFAWPEGAAAWGLFLTLLVIAWQSAETGDAAKAALLNAQAVINAERAWLVVKIQKSPNPARFPAENYINVLTNEGRTPAMLISIHIENTFIGFPDDLPVPPVYGPRWLVSIPEKTFVVGQNDLPIGPSLDLKKAIVMHRPKPPQIENSQEFFVWYGRVAYEDVFGAQGTTSKELHETRWCYAWVEREERFVVCGPEEYNRHT
jgi:hypothetical protein